MGGPHDKIAAPMNAETPPSSLQGYAAALATALIWSGFMLLARMAGQHALTSWDVVALRLGTAGLVLLPFCIKLPPGTWRNPRLWALSLTGGFLFLNLVYAGLSRAPAAHGGVFLSGLQPFIITMLAWWILGARPARERIGGLLAIALGVTCVSAPQLVGSHAGASTLRGDLLMVCASLAWATYSVMVRKWVFDVWLLTRFLAVASALVYIPIYVWCLPKNLGAAPWSMLALQAVYQGVITTIVAMLLFLRAISILGPERTGAIVAIVPVVVGLAAVPLLGEPLTLWLLGGMVLVSAGAYLAARPLRSIPHR